MAVLRLNANMLWEHARAAFNWNTFLLIVFNFVVTRNWWLILDLFESLYNHNYIGNLCYTSYVRAQIFKTWKFLRLDEYAYYNLKIILKSHECACIFIYWNKQNVVSIEFEHLPFVCCWFSQRNLFSDWTRSGWRLHTL